jgi:hypothetical protein
MLAIQVPVQIEEHGSEGSNEALKNKYKENNTRR